MKTSCVRIRRGPWPVKEQGIYHFVTQFVGCFKRRQVCAVGSDALMGEAVGGGDAARLLIEVADGAQDEDALPVDAACLCEVFEGLEGARVLHRGGCELSFAAGEVADPLVGPGVGELAVPVGGGGYFVPEGDEG